jgi:hypothetical protein
MTTDTIALENGRAEALADIQAGRGRLFWGARGDWGRFLAAAMQDRFQVELVWISDMTSDKQTSFQRGYNAEIKAYVDQTFGDGSFDGVLEEVRQFRNRLYANWHASKRAESSD